MGAQVLVEGVPTSVLPVVPACGPYPGAARYRTAVLGRGGGRNGAGRQARRSAVQHRRAGGGRVPGRLGVPYVHAARARWHAVGRHGVSERRTHSRGWWLPAIRVHSEVSAANRVRDVAENATNTGYDHKLFVLPPSSPTGKPELCVRIY